MTMVGRFKTTLWQSIGTVDVDVVKERVEGVLKVADVKQDVRQGSVDARQKGCEGCNCTNLTNTHLPAPNVTGSMEEMSIEEIIEDASPEDLDEIMEWVFGDNTTERVSGTKNDSDSD